MAVDWRSYDAWRRAVPTAPAPAAAPVSPSYAAWNRAVPTTAGPLGGPAPGRMPTYDERLNAQAAPAVVPPVRRRSQAELLARFRALVASGFIDPRNVEDANGNLRPEVMAQLDAIGPYRGPGVVPGEQGRVIGNVPGDIANPAELSADIAARTFISGEEAANVLRSGMYQDPTRGGGSYVTAARGNELLDRFGNARAAEDRYRQQQLQANVGAMGYQGNIADLEARRNAIAAAQPYGTANIGNEAQIAAVNRQIQEATLAYNRARGAGQQVVRPITQDVLARGMTPEQFAQLGEATRQGYSDEEWEERMRTAGNVRAAQYLPAQDYRRAAMARGVPF
jgi:hypothetical protein